MGDTHIVVKNVEGDDPKRRWHTTETYKVDESVAKELAAMKEKPTGYDLQSWLRDRGGVLDDDKGKPASVSVKNDGTTLNDHYKNGERGESHVVRPKHSNAKDAKSNDHAGAELFLALLTGGTSLFIPHKFDDDAKKPDSKFAKTDDDAPEKPKTAAKKHAATTAPSTKPKP